VEVGGKRVCLHSFLRFVENTLGEPTCLLIESSTKNIGIEARDDRTAVLHSAFQADLFLLSLLVVGTLDILFLYGETDYHKISNRQNIK
jgi:hypothetical protein